MKILYIAHRIPYPPNKGDKIRSFNEIKYLSEKYEVHLACLTDDLRDLRYINDLKKYCKVVKVVPLQPKLAKLKGIFCLFSKKPLSIAYFYSKKLQKAINDLLLNHKYHAIICFSSPMAEYIFRSTLYRAWLEGRENKQSTNQSSLLPPTSSEPPATSNQQPVSSNQQPATSILDFVDIDSDKWRQYAQYTKWPFSWIYKVEAQRLAKYEKEAAKFFHHSIFVSQKEAELFKKRNRYLNNISVIPNGVDFAYFNPHVISQQPATSIQPRATSNQQPATSNQQPATSIQQPATRNQQPVLLFTGTMDYYANVDGVSWFVKQIFPLIKREIPHVKFYIVGARPTTEVQRLGNNEGIVVTGFVKDIREYLARAHVFVAPLRIARGIQNKVLEAMAMGIPVVATPQAFEGINARPDKDLIVEEDPQRFAHQVIRIIKDKSLRHYLGHNARKVVETNYHWERNLEALDKIISNSSVH